VVEIYYTRKKKKQWEELKKQGLVTDELIEAVKRNPLL
jgi:hypothetical protein